MSFNYSPSIVNTIIVNNKYEKIITSRNKNVQQTAYNFTDKPSGVYRLYFVVQDDEYRILEYGKINIQKE